METEVVVLGNLWTYGQNPEVDEPVACDGTGGVEVGPRDRQSDGREYTYVRIYGEVYKVLVDLIQPL